MTETTSSAVAPLISVEISSAWEDDDTTETAEALPNWLPDPAFCENCLSAGISLLRRRDLQSAPHQAQSSSAESPLPLPRTYDISIRFAGSAESKQLNATYRGRNNSTNVLSFPIAEDTAQWLTPLDIRDSGNAKEADSQVAALGELVLCPSIIEGEAIAQHKSLENHWAHLLIHGLFHLLNFDHINEEDAEEMESLEIETLRSLGIPNPYLLD
jgi:probable rRNA maturation factor